MIPVQFSLRNSSENRWALLFPRERPVFIEYESPLDVKKKKIPRDVLKQIRQLCVFKPYTSKRVKCLNLWEIYVVFYEML